VKLLNRDKISEKCTAFGLDNFFQTN